MGSKSQDPAKDPFLARKHCAILDSICVEEQKTFYVMDIIHWEDIDYTDYPLCSRMLFLQQKFSSIIDLNDESQPYKFKLIEYIPCSTTNFLTCMYGSHLIPYINT